MRTLRLLLAGTLVPVLLTGFGLGLAALSADESDGDGPVADYFTAETEWTPFSVGTLAHDFWEFTGPTLASDERLTGDSTVMFIETNDGRLRIRNDDGRWFGPLEMAPGEGRYGAWLVGAGAYKGLTAFVHGTMEFPLTEAGDFDWFRSKDGPPTAASTIEGWVFSEPKSRPAWMKDFR